MDNDYDLTIVTIKRENSDSEDDEIALAQLKIELERNKTNKIKEEAVGISKVCKSICRNDSITYPTQDCQSDRSTQNLGETSLPLQQQHKPIITVASLNQQNKNTTKPFKCHMVDDFIIYEIDDLNNTSNVSNTSIQTSAQQTSKKQVLIKDIKKQVKNPPQQISKKRVLIKEYTSKGQLSTTIKEIQKEPRTLLNLDIAQRTFRQNIGTILKKKLEPMQKMTQSTNRNVVTSKSSSETTKTCDNIPKMNEIAEKAYNLPKVYSGPKEIAKPVEAYKLPSGLTLTRIAAETYDARNKPTINAIASQTLASTTTTSSTTTSSTTSSTTKTTSSSSTSPKSLKHIKIVPIRKIDTSTIKPSKQKIVAFQHNVYEAKNLRTDTSMPASEPPPNSSQQQHNKRVPSSTVNMPHVPENTNLKCPCYRKSTNETSDLYARLELKDFFEKMFEETSKLCSIKRKIIKTELLNSVCKAEEDVEAGMLCENCYTANLAPTPLEPIERSNPETSSDSSESALEDKLKKNGKRFRKAWLRDYFFKDWLEPIQGKPFQAKCKTCDKILCCGKSELKKHGKSFTHRRHQQIKLFGTILGKGES